MVGLGCCMHEGLGRPFSRRCRYTPRGPYWSSSLATMKERRAKEGGDRSERGGQSRSVRNLPSLSDRYLLRNPPTSFSLSLFLVAEGSSLVPLPFGRSPFVHTHSIPILSTFYLLSCPSFLPSFFLWCALFFSCLPCNIHALYLTSRIKKEDERREKGGDGVNFKNFAFCNLKFWERERERDREWEEVINTYLVISINWISWLNENIYMMGAYLKQRGEMDGQCFCVFRFCLFCFVSFRVARSPFEKG